MGRFLSICVGARVVACRGKPSDGSSNKISGNKSEELETTLMEMVRQDNR
ncbi:hypothetical protein NC651_021801 [Populus alba x Populus x berolinensis]|nr:hypothetical protein NC651_021801 [Populus alba x Populus x berolinensis]